MTVLRMLAFRPGATSGDTGSGKHGRRDRR